MDILLEESDADSGGEEIITDEDLHQLLKACLLYKNYHECYEYRFIKNEGKALSLNEITIDTFKMQKVSKRLPQQLEQSVCISKL